MTIPASILVTMATIGLNAEQAKAVAEMLALVEAETLAVVEQSRAKTRDRVQRWRDTHKTVSNVTERNETLPTVTVPLTGGDARVDFSLQKQKIEPEVKKESKTPASELAPVLDKEHTDAVIEHRQRIRKPLTAHAAKLLAGNLRKFPDPNVAADKMIERGWSSIEPGWGEARAGPANGNYPAKGLAALQENLRNEIENERRNGEESFDLEPVGRIPDFAKQPH